MGICLLGDAVTDPILAELLTLWSRLPDEMRQSLLRIARTKAGTRANAMAMVVREQP